MVFGGDGRAKNEVGFGMSAADFAEVGGVVAFELFEAIESGEGLVHAEAKNDVVGRPFGEEVLKVIDVTFRAEAVADFVAGPGEAAEFEVLVRVGEVNEGFEGAGFLKAFDEGVAVEKNAVAFLEVDLGGEGEWEEEQERQKNRSHRRNRSDRSYRSYRSYRTYFLLWFLWWRRAWVMFSRRPPFSTKSFSRRRICWSRR